MIVQYWIHFTADYIDVQCSQIFNSKYLKPRLERLQFLKSEFKWDSYIYSAWLKKAPSKCSPQHSHLAFYWSMEIFKDSRVFLCLWTPFHMIIIPREWLQWDCFWRNLFPFYQSGVCEEVQSVVNLRQIEVWRVHLEIGLCDKP